MRNSLISKLSAVLPRVGQFIVATSLKYQRYQQGKSHERPNKSPPSRRTRRRVYLPKVQAWRNARTLWLAAPQPLSLVLVESACG